MLDYLASIDLVLNDDKE